MSCLNILNTIPPYNQFSLSSSLSKSKKISSAVYGCISNFVSFNGNFIIEYHRHQRHNNKHKKCTNYCYNNCKKLYFHFAAFSSFGSKNVPIFLNFSYLLFNNSSFGRASSSKRYLFIASFIFLAVNS